MNDECGANDVHRSSFILHHSSFIVHRSSFSVHPYFIFLKGSRYGTLGYRIMGAQLVSLRGETPSWSALVTRWLFHRPAREQLRLICSGSRVDAE